MQGIVFSTLSDVTALQNKIDARLGYPSQGVNVPGGTHADPSQCITLHEAAFFKHPTLAQWAHRVTPKIVARLALLRADLPSVTIPDPVVLTSDWAPDPTPGVVSAAAVGP